MRVRPSDAAPVRLPLTTFDYRRTLVLCAETVYNDYTESNSPSVQAMKKDPRLLRRTNIYLTSRQHSALEKEAKRLGITISELIRRALDRYVATIRRGAA